MASVKSDSLAARLTLQLNGFRVRENTQEEKIQTLKLARFIHFMRFKENPLPDS